MAEQAQGDIGKVSGGTKRKGVPKGPANRKRKTRAENIEEGLRGDIAVVPAYAPEVEEGPKRFEVEGQEAMTS